MIRICLVFYFQAVPVLIDNTAAETLAASAVRMSVTGSVTVMADAKTRKIVVTFISI